MPLSNRRREKMLASCDEIQEDDGVDPRRFFKTRPGRKNRDRKTQQLCRQIEQTLSLVLSGEFDDEVLQSLVVQSVVPAPNASQVLVTVSPESGQAASVDAGAVLERLKQVSGRLRSEVAIAITRRRTPQLTFQLAASADR